MCVVCVWCVSVLCVCVVCVWCVCVCVVCVCGVCVCVVCKVRVSHILPFVLVSRQDEERFSKRLHQTKGTDSSGQTGGQLLPDINM